MPLIALLAKALAWFESPRGVIQARIVLTMAAVVMLALVIILVPACAGGGEPRTASEFRQRAIDNLLSDDLNSFVAMVCAESRWQLDVFDKQKLAASIEQYGRVKTLDDGLCLLDWWSPTAAPSLEVTATPDPSGSLSTNVYPDSVRGDLLDHCRFNNNSREYCFCILRKLEGETLFEDYDSEAFNRAEESCGGPREHGDPVSYGWWAENIDELSESERDWLHPASSYWWEPAEGDTQIYFTIPTGYYAFQILSQEENLTLGYGSSQLVISPDGEEVSRRVSDPQDGPIFDAILATITMVPPFEESE